MSISDRYQAIGEPHVAFVWCMDCGAAMPHGLWQVHDEFHRRLDALEAANAPATLCDVCKEAIAVCSRWDDAAGVKLDLCTLCAMPYDGPAWSSDGSGLSPSTVAAAFGEHEETKPK